MLGYYTFIRALRAKLNFNKKSLAEISLIAIKHDYSLCTEQHVLYFYNYKEMFVLPVQVYGNIDRLINLSENGSIYKCFNTLIFLLNLDLKFIVINILSENSSHAGLSFSLKNNVFDLNINLIDAVCLAKDNNLPIYTYPSVLSKFGIKLSKEILEKALKC